MVLYSQRFQFKDGRYKLRYFSKERHFSRSRSRAVQHRGPEGISPRSAGKGEKKNHIGMGWPNSARPRNTYWGDSIQEKKQKYHKGTALGKEGRGRRNHRHEDGHDKNQAHVEQHPGEPRSKTGGKKNSNQSKNSQPQFFTHRNS